MKYLSRVLAAALSGICLPALASASTLDLDAGQSTFSLSISTLPPVMIPNNAATIVVSSGGGTFTEPSGVFGPTTNAIPRSLFTGVSLISGLTLAGIGVGAVDCTSITTSLNCSGGLSGSALVNVLQLFNLTIPLSVVGNPGASAVAGGGGIVITVVGQKWKAGPTSVTGTGDAPPLTGVALSNGEDNRTAGHKGSLVLVSGFKAITNVAGTLPGFAKQNLTFTPEPIRLLGVAAAAGALGFLVHLRRRRK